MYHKLHCFKCTIWHLWNHRLWFHCLWNHHSQDNERFHHRQLFHFRVEQDECSRFKTMVKAIPSSAKQGCWPCRAIFIPISVIIAEAALHVTATWRFLLPMVTSSFCLKPTPFLVLWFTFLSPFPDISTMDHSLSLLNHPLPIYKLFSILKNKQNLTKN